MGATVTPMRDYGMQGLRTTLLTLAAAVAFVLLIACVNVANLLLARGAVRQKEFAIRRALGAAGFRIARQLLTESVLLALAGGAAGLLLAGWSTRLLFLVFKLDALNLPMRPVDSIAMDGRVFAFVLLVSCLTGVLFGMAPALSAWRGDINAPLKEGGRSASTSGRNRLRNVLVASEVALAVVVLCGAGLMIKSMTRLLGVDPGLNAKNVLTMEMSVPQDEIYVGPPGLPRFCRDIDERVGAIAGVVSVGAVAHLPFEGNAGRGFHVEGQPPAEPGKMPGANYSVACPNYFRTMGIPILKGREFTKLDTLTAPGVIVINQAMAHSFWPKEDPIGRAIRLGGVDGPRLTVVGIAGDVHHQGLDVPVHRQFFRPYTQAGWPTMKIVVRTVNGPTRFAAPIKQALADVLPERPVSGVETMEDIVHNSTGSRRFPYVAAQRVFGASPGAGGGRHRGRSGPFGDTAVPRDRHSHGARRENPGCASADGDQQHGLGITGTRERHCRLGRAHAAAGSTALRRASARSCGAGRCIAATGRRGAARHLPAGAASSENRSRGGSALRMTATLV